MSTRDLSDVKELLDLHDELLAWVEQFSGSTTPMPSVMISDDHFALDVGEIRIWDSEDGWADEQEGELTIGRAIACYKAVIAEDSAWPS